MQTSMFAISGALAQLGERFAGSEEVRSSILLGSTTFILLVIILTLCL